MPKHVHEIRDPIHVFVRLDSTEREVLDSAPFQRLRHIHQLALTYLVYPGATHRRFEHSLGVMELATRVFDVVTARAHLTDEIRERLGAPREQFDYWRRVLRMAALCHDIGHLPFSHAAEELLPDGWNHERLTRALIESEPLRSVWHAMTPPLRCGDIVKLALGPGEARDLTFSSWESILADIIVGDAFGVDRMDYLLRDSHHTGVAYGKFDHYRLIDTLRILRVPDDPEAETAGELALGLEEGGRHSAEALMLARYFMYSQVCFHPVRRIYDIHLLDFLRETLSDGVFSIEVQEHLRCTDDEMTVMLRQAADDPSRVGHVHANRIVHRRHFKVVYQRNPADVEINPEAGADVYEALCSKYGPDMVRRDRSGPRSVSQDFPVELADGVVSSVDVSTLLKEVPVWSVDNVFAHDSVAEEAKKWVQENREEIIRLPEEEDDE
ncbi:MAG: HD domain-containing protein [Acidobacteria bacterium]|nr:HD domain-containing protein [Acidobacteriota bacterium]MYJ04795.1 HD domain-containing protein [Acidobacteriota bacterium]